MNNALKTFCFCVFALLCALPSGTAFGQIQQTDSTVENLLTVGTKDAPPFAMKRADGEWEGISIDLWRELARKTGVRYEWRETDLEGLLRGVEQDSLDLAIAALTITASRESQADFSHPYFQTGLGIAVKVGSGGWFGVAKRLFSLEFLSVVAALLFVLLAVGVVIWFVERKHNPEQFGGSMAQGIGSGFWWSAVTMTTVGYGDKAPVTFIGRIIGLVWMFAAIIIISSFTAGIAASLTVSELETTVTGAGDLPNARVGAVENSTGAVYLQKRDVSFRGYATVEEGMEALQSGKIDAMVHDAPMLKYLKRKEFDGDIVVLPETLDKQFYGIALPAGSSYRESLNRALLEVLASPEWKIIVGKYLGGE